MMWRPIFGRLGLAVLISLALSNAEVGVAAGALLGQTTSNVLVRDAPSGNRIDSLSAQTVVGVLGFKNGWVQVVYLTPNGRGKNGWISAQYVRVTTGVKGARRGGTSVSGDDCTTEFDSGAQVCVSVADADLNCNDSFTGNYYDNCEVLVEYEIQTDYEGDDYLSVDVECEVEISYSGRTMYLHGSDSDSQGENHTLFEYGSESNTLTFDFSFGSLEEVTRAELESASCEVDSAVLL